MLQSLDSKQAGQEEKAYKSPLDFLGGNMNKKGVLGLDTAKVVIISILVLAVAFIALLLVTTEVRNVYESADTLKTGKVNNQTTTKAINVSKWYSLTTVSDLRNPVCTILFVTNSTGKLASTGNYTTMNSGCAIKGTTDIDAGFNNSLLNISYSYTYNSPEAYEVTENTSEGVINFFKQVPTFFTLIAVVVLILIIAIVIIAVSRFQGGENSMREEL